MIEICAEGEVAARGVAHVAGVLSATVAARGRATVAVSGGSTGRAAAAGAADVDVP